MNRVTAAFIFIVLLITAAVVLLVAAAVDIVRALWVGAHRAFRDLF